MTLISVETPVIQRPFEESAREPIVSTRELWTPP